MVQSEERAASAHPNGVLCRIRYRARLLATTSILGFGVLAMAIAPVAIDPSTGAVTFVSAQADSGSTCFVAGTKVMMADGSDRNIEDVGLGDRVMGFDGAVSTVMGLDRTALGRRKLYSINGGKHFVTAEHPFRAEDGWKSIDPAATRGENPLLYVAPLRVGDQIYVGQAYLATGLRDGNLALEPMIDVAHELVAVTTIESLTCYPSLPLYNLYLDGDHTYHADGYVVHNKGGGGGGAGGSGHGGAGGAGAGGSGVGGLGGEGSGGSGGGGGGGSGGGGGGAGSGGGEGVGGSGGSGSGDSGSGDDGAGDDGAGDDGSSSGDDGTGDDGSSSGDDSGGDAAGGGAGGDGSGIGGTGL